MMKYLILLTSALLGAANPQLPFGDSPASSGSGYSYDSPNLNTASSNFNRVVANRNPVGSLADSIPGGGVPGQDYPILASVPNTGFTCTSQQFPGYYADTQSGCQAFHICQFDGRQDSFLCPNGSIFNQQYFVCDWWFNVDCAASQQFISLNADIGKVPAGNLVGSASNISPSTSYGVPSASNGFGQVSAASNSFNQVSAASNSFSQVSAASNTFNQVSAASNSFGQVAAPSQSYGAPN
ncbi:uncharacterized protein [Palaemon carinicauda]|uniref:uncharacterized protein n=1 Tax=Palaemon carinicauda TaxID=392227 RepID=UPI0035B59251